MALRAAEAAGPRRGTERPAGGTSGGRPRNWRHRTDVEMWRPVPRLEPYAMTDTPEQRARREIDANIEAAGWLVQDRAEMDLTLGPGVAVREFPMTTGFGSADYVLYVGARYCSTLIRSWLGSRRLRRARPSGSSTRTS